MKLAFIEFTPFLKDRQVIYDKGANGKTYKSDYRAILNWVVKRYQEEQSKPARADPISSWVEKRQRMKAGDGND